MPHLSVSWHRSKGYRYEVCRLSFFIPPACAFFENPKSMSKYNYASGAIHIDHHKDLNIDVKSVDDAIRLMSAFMAEDVTPVQEDVPAQESFPFLTSKCIQEKRVATVEAEIRAACKGTAESLWRTLWNNENLGLVEVEHLEASTLYRGIEKWYGQLPYNERNFRKARNKR